MSKMTEKDKGRLRELTGRYAEYAHGEPMARRREKWRVHNRLQEKTFPFHIEDNGSYLGDLTPPLECEGDECRALEGRLLYALVSYEMIDDDRIIPDRFLIDWCTPMTVVCDELQYTRADNGRGSSLGYKTSKPIKDIDADWGKLKKRTISLDRHATERQAQLAEEVFDGLLPVEIGRPSSLYSYGVTNMAVLLMGMQELYLQMAMNPDAGSPASARVAQGECHALVRSSETRRSLSGRRHMVQETRPAEALRRDLRCRRPAGPSAGNARRWQRLLHRVRVPGHEPSDRKHEGPGCADMRYDSAHDRPSGRQPPFMTRKRTGQATGGGLPKPTGHLLPAPF